MNSLVSSDNRSGSGGSIHLREAAPDRNQSCRTLFSDGGIPEENEENDDDEDTFGQPTLSGIEADLKEESAGNELERLGVGTKGREETICEEMETSEGTRSQTKEYPDQDIDVTGPSTGKKITDDLAEVRDKMHELTWHLFDDHTYVIKNPNAIFFNEARKGKARSSDPKKDMDKYLHVR